MSDEFDNQDDIKKLMNMILKQHQIIKKLREALEDLSTSGLRLGRSADDYVERVRKISNDALLEVAEMEKEGGT